MARLRSNLQYGTITDNPLLIGATTINSAEFASLPVVASPDILAIIMDPDEIDGAGEIIWITAHSASATSATVLRGQEGTTARQHVAGTPWVHGPTVEDFEGRERVGAIKMWGAGTVPSVYLELIGQAVSRTTYADLFALWGTTYGAGDGSTTFNVMDMQNLIPIGAGTNVALNATAGSWNHVHTVTISDHPVHAHQVPIHGHANSFAIVNHPSHTHSIPAHGHTHTIGVSAHASHTHDTNIAHEHSFFDSFTTSTHNMGATDTTTNPSGSRTNQSSGHTGSVSGTTTGGPTTKTSGGPSASLTHSVTGGIDNAAGTNTGNESAALTHPITGGVTNAAAFNTENAAAMAHVIGGGSGNTGQANPPVRGLKFIVRAL